MLWSDGGEAVEELQVLILTKYESREPHMNFVSSIIRLECLCFCVVPMEEERGARFPQRPIDCRGCLEYG